MLRSIGRFLARVLSIGLGLSALVLFLGGVQHSSNVNYVMAAVLTFIAWKVWPAALEDEQVEPERPFGRSAARSNSPTASLPSQPTRSLTPRSGPSSLLDNLERSARRRKDERERVRWIPNGHSVRIAGREVSGGMLYVGSDLDGKLWHSTIDPSHPVARSYPDRDGTTLPYWPSYHAMTPEARLTFVQWLVGGRNDLTIDIGYVFVFFYGLERRLFAEQAYGEADVLMAEVERLLGSYGANSSFSRYATTFLETARGIAAVRTDDAKLPSINEPPRGWEFPFETLVALGHQVASDPVLDGEWMFVWYVSDPKTRLRTPAQRCFILFKALFLLRFAEAYPKGLRVTPPKRKIAFDYVAASSDFTVELKADVPDVSGLSAPVRKMETIAENCTEELAAYSRLVGRDPEAKASPRAIALLPTELASHVDGPEKHRFVQWLTAGLEPRPVPVTDLLERLDLPSGKSTRVPKGTMRTARDVLQGFGYALEPDPDRTGITPGQSDAVIVFANTDGSDAGFAHAYDTAVSGCIVAAVAAHADGTIADEERDLVLRQSSDNRYLSPTERLHVQALGEWFLRVPPRTAALKKVLADLPRQDAAEIIATARAVVMADGKLDERETAFLKKLHALLDLDFEPMGIDLSVESAVADDLAMVREADLAEDFELPPVREPTKPAVSLDRAAVCRIRGETDRVSSVLARVFVEEDPTVDEGPTFEVEAGSETPDPDDALDGLDRRHRSLLDELLRASSASSEEFERLCRQRKLLPGGAVETINEWAFDRFDEPIIEEGSTITVRKDLLEAA